MTLCLLSGLRGDRGGSSQGESTRLWRRRTIPARHASIRPRGKRSFRRRVGTAALALSGIVGAQSVVLTPATRLAFDCGTAQECVATYKQLVTDEVELVEHCLLDPGTLCTGLEQIVLDEAQNVKQLLLDEVQAIQYCLSAQGTLCDVLERLVLSETQTVEQLVLSEGSRSVTWRSACSPAPVMIRTISSSTPCGTRRRLRIWSNRPRGFKVYDSAFDNRHRVGLAELSAANQADANSGEIVW